MPDTYIRNDRVLIDATNLGAGSDTNLNLGDYFYKTLSADFTLTISNPPATGKSFGFILELTKDATATERFLTFPASVKWDGDVDPVSLTTTGQVMLIGFTTRNAGTTYHAVLISRNSK